MDLDEEFDKMYGDTGSAQKDADLDAEFEKAYGQEPAPVPAADDHSTPLPSKDGAEGEVVQMSHEKPGPRAVSTTGGNEEKVEQIAPNLFMKGNLLFDSENRTVKPGQFVVLSRKDGTSQLLSFNGANKNGKPVFEDVRGVSSLGADIAGRIDIGEDDFDTMLAGGKAKRSRSPLEQVRLGLVAETGDEEKYAPGFVGTARAVVDRMLPYAGRHSRDLSMEQLKHLANIHEGKLDGYAGKNDDERLGVAAADAGLDYIRPGETREAYSMRIRAEADEMLKKRSKAKERAGAELGQTEASAFDKIVKGGVESGGYALEFALPGGVFGKAGQVLGTGRKALRVVSALGSAVPVVAAESRSRYVENTTPEYGVDEHGELERSAAPDSESEAAYKAIGGAALDTAVEIGLESATMGLLRLVGKPAGMALGKMTPRAVKDLGERTFNRFMASETGAALRSINRARQDFTSITQINSPFGELMEENVQAFEKVLNLDGKTSEYKGFEKELKDYWDRQADWDTQWDIFYGLVAQLAIGAAKSTSDGLASRVATADARRDVRMALARSGISEGAINSLTTKQQKVLTEMWRRYSADPDALKDRAKNLGISMRAAVDELTSREGIDMARSLEQRGIAPEKFAVQVGADGKPAFHRMNRVASDGKSVPMNAMVDEGHGVTIVDQGDGTFYVMNDQRGFTARMADGFAAAKQLADNEVMDNQRRDADNEKKAQYLANLAQGMYTGRDIKVVPTEAALRWGLASAFKNGETPFGLVDAAQVFDADGRLKQRGAGGFHTPDGTVVVILDNVASPSEMERVLAHEATGHEGVESNTGRGENTVEFIRNAKADGFERYKAGERARYVSALVRSGMGEEAANAVADEAMSTDSYQKEAMARYAQGRLHRPTWYERKKHEANEKRRADGESVPFDQADMEVMLAKDEEEGRSPGGKFDIGNADSGVRYFETEQEAADETGNVRDEAPAQPEQGSAGSAGGEAARPVEAQPQGGEAPRHGAVEAAKTGAAEAPTEAPPPMKTEHDFLRVMHDNQKPVRVPVGEISLPDTQFKEGADPKTGVVKGQELKGEYFESAENAVVVYVRKDGTKELVTGRHRFDLAKRNGKNDILARVFREADGYTPEDMRNLDAISNIIDEKGTEHDYIRYFENAKPSRAAAEAAGFLSRSKGRLAFELYEGATEGTRAAIDWSGSGADGLISPEQAGIIAKAAPRDAHPRNGAVQRILVKKAQDGLRGDRLAIVARSLAEEAKRRKAPAADGETQLDLFTSEEDLALLALEEKRAARRVQKANEYGRVAGVLQTAMQKGGRLDLNKAYARELGIKNPKDRKQLADARQKALEKADYWRNAVRLDEADRAALDAELGIAPKENLELESVTGDQIAEENRKRAEKEEIERRKAAPLKGGAGEVGQSLMDLGGAEGEDLFNRTQRQEPVAEKPAKQARPVQGTQAPAPKAETAVFTGKDGTKEPIEGYVAPMEGDIAPRREVVVQHDTGGEINARQKILGTVKSISGDRVTVGYRDPWGNEQADTFSRSEIVGVKPLPQTRENGPVSAPKEAGATTPPRAAKPAEGRKSGDMAVAADGNAAEGAGAEDPDVAEKPENTTGGGSAADAGRDARKVVGTDYTVARARELLREDVEASIADAAEELGADLRVVGVDLHGSRVRGDARPDSDLDLVVEYEGDAREDDLFDALNADPIDFHGIRVDVNPIRADKTGTLAEYMARSDGYDREKLAAKPAPKPAAPAPKAPKTPSVRMKDEAAERKAKDALDAIDFDTPELDGLKSKIRNGTILTEADQRQFAEDVRKGRMRYPRFRADEIAASTGKEHGKLWQYILSLESARMDGRRARGGSEVYGRAASQVRRGGSEWGRVGTGSAQSPSVAYSKKYRKLDSGTESEVFDTGDGWVVKVRQIHPLSIGDVIDELAKVVYHNYLFPGEKYVLDDIVRHEHDGYREFYLILRQPFVTPKTENGRIVQPTYAQIWQLMKSRPQGFTFMDLSSRPAETGEYGDYSSSDGDEGEVVPAVKKVAYNRQFVVYDFQPGRNTFIDAKSGKVRFIDPRIDINDPGAGFRYSKYGTRRKFDGEVDFDTPELGVREKQTALSGGTSRNRNPSGNEYGRKWKIFRPGTRNVDIGAGRFDKATQFLADIGVENIPFDPVNRDGETNRRAAESVRANPADTATVHNVLNVIDNDSVMEGIVNQAARAIKKNGSAIFTIYEGNRSGVGARTRDGYQRNAKARSYEPTIKKFFGSVETHGNVILARRPKDIGPAFWAFDSSFENGINFDTPDFDPERFGKLVTGVGKLVDVLVESGHREFKALATYIYERDAAKYGRAKPVLRNVWNQIADLRGLDEVSRKDAERVFGIIEAQDKEAADENVRRGVRGEVLAGEPAAGGGGSVGLAAGQSAAGGGERQPGGVLAGGRVRTENPDARVDGKRPGGLPGQHEGLADKGAAEGVRQGHAGNEAADGDDAVGDRGGSELGERASGRDRTEDGDQGGVSRVKKRADKAADATKPNPPRRDFVMTRSVEDAILEKNTAQRVRNNLDAIKLIRDLKARDYAATPEEQATLAKFVGWGGLREKVFGYALERAYDLERTGDRDRAMSLLRRERVSQSAYDLHKELRSVLNDSEYESAKVSASTAFYTPVDFVRVLHDALRNIGVKGGRFLGPSAGTGNFASAAGEYEKPVNWHFVEKDVLTGEMLKALFPNQRVTIGGFEETKFPDGFFDFAIDNVPYADVPISDRSLSSRMFKIHDYFFAKTLAKMRPGGVMAFLTSTGTLDKTSPILRQFLTEHGGKIVGAVRLPNGFFSENAGTDVASDLVVVQKVQGRPDNSAFEKGVEYGKTEEWVRRKGRIEKPLAYNGYFQNHPEQVVGTMEVASGQFGPTLKYTMPDGASMLDKVGNAVKNAFNGVDRDALLKSAAVAERQDHTPVYDKEGLRQGNVTMQDGKAFIKSGEFLEPIALPNDRKLANEMKRRGRTPSGIMEGLLALRKAMRDVIDAQMSESDTVEADLAPLLANLNAVYDAFVQKNGTLHDRLISPFVLLDKADGNRMLALERVEKFKNEKTGKDESRIVKSDIFTKRVISRGQRATKADTPKDALVISYSESGAINVPRIAELLGVSGEEAVKKLKEGGDAFENPQTGILEPSWVYLSGRVRAKLAAARAAVEAGDESFRANVEALEKVQPPMVRLEDAEIKFGATWVDPECMKDFLRDAFGAENMRISLGKNEVTGQWNVEFGRVMNEDPWGETSWSPQEFVSRVLNHGSMNHYETDPIDKKRHLDERKTEANKLAAEKLHSAFSQFIQSSDKWAAPMYERYNAVMTDMVEIKLPNNVLPFRSAGMSEETLGKLFEGGDPNKPKKGREYQSAVIARGVLGGGSLCLAHCVGAGKTLEMQSIGVLGRHLGLFKKPMYVVPNHMLEQFTNEFVEAFPNANILKMSETDVTPANRRVFFAQVANGDWDAIVVKHSTFSKKLAMSDEYQKEFMEAQRKDLIEAIAAMREAGEKISVDQATKKLERLEAKLKKLANAENHDSQIVPFEELGVDQLFVDEAHNFKGMPITTRQGRTGGLSQGDSQRAEDMLMKTQYVQSLHGGDRGVVFATGTPLSNAPVVEAYVMLKYLVPNKLDEQGLKHFDDFVDAFGRITTESEFSTDGKTVKEKDKVSAFVNIPELMKLLRSAVDIVNSDQLDIPRPKPKYHMIDVDMSPAQEQIMEMVAREAAIPPTKEQRNKYLTLTRIAKNACLTPRLLGFEDGGNKIVRAVAEIKRVYDETADNRGAQLVFTDIFNESKKTRDMVDAYMAASDEKTRGVFDSLARRGGKGGAYNLNDEIRDLLVAAGIPKVEIAIVQDIDKSKGDKDANKSALFAKVRSGEVRVLIGSRPKMGEGTNVQERLAAIHLLHPGWKPSEDEQAIGRIIRPGNTYKEGQIFYYLTKGNANIGSYETKNHQLIGVKSKLIDQVMHGDDSRREIDMDESAMDRDMLMGLASGNKALMELIDVKKRAHKLELNTESTLTSARRNKDKAEASGRILERKRGEFAQEQEGVKEWREKNDGRSFALTTPDGRSVEKMKDMAELVSGEMTRLLTKDRYDRAERTVLGDFNGVELVLAFDRYGDEKFKLAVPLLGVEREINYSGFVPDFTTAAMTAFKGRILEAVSPDYAKAYENSLNDMERQAKKMSADADKLQKDYEGMRGELIKLRTRQAQLEREVTPLVVQAVADRKVAAYGNWIIAKPGGGQYVARRESDAKSLSAPTVKELIPLMDAEDFASQRNAATKTIDLRSHIKPNSKGEYPHVDTLSAGQVDFDTPGLYTGSAADYEKPSLHYVGTGKGSQVYGWGLYASNRRGVAESYAKNNDGLYTFDGRPIEYISVALSPQEKAIKAFTAANGDKNRARETLVGNAKRARGKSRKEWDDAVEWFDENGGRLATAKPHLYEQTWFTDRAPGDESHLLKWYGKVTTSQKKWIKAQAEREGLDVSNIIWDGGKIDGAMLYKYLATPSYLGSPKAASEFLARAGIDGVKYPVGSYGKAVKDGDEAGWNYVSFRDDNIRVDHKWADGEIQFDTPELTPAEEAYAEAEDKTPTEQVMRKVYGMTNDEIATALKAAAMEPPRHVRKTDETAWKQAEALLSNPSYMAKLSSAVAKFPRNIADYENNALNVLFRRRQAAVNAAQSVADSRKETLDAINAIPKGERDADYGESLEAARKAYGEAASRLAQAKALMHETGFALTRSSSEAGRRLRSNRGLIDQTDLSYAGISGRMATALGGADKITPEMDAKIREIAGEFASLDEEGRDLATARLKAHAEKIVEQIKRGDKVRKATERKQGDEAKRVMRNYNDALAQIEVGAAEVGGTLVGLSDQQYPAWGKWLRAIGEFHCFENPDITEEECVRAIVEDISPFMDGVDENQVRDALTGFGHNFRQSRYDAQRLMNDLRSQARLKRQMDWMDETNTMPPLTGMVRDEPSDTTRNLQKQVQERKKEVPDAGRDERRLKGVLESAKTRVKNRIADLERAIETGERIPGRDRTVPEDIELRELKKRRDALQQSYDELFKTERGLTDEQRVKLAERLLGRELEHALEDLDRARSGDFSKRPKRPGVESPSIDALRDRLNDVREQIRELKAAKYEFGMTPEELAAYNARKMANREKALMRLAERIVNGDLRPQKKPQPPMPPEMQKRYDAMGEQMKKARQKLAEMRLEAEDATLPSFWRKAGDYLRFVTTAQRALRATMDFSAVLRQSARITLAHPVMGAKAFGKAWNAAHSEANLSVVNDEIMSDPSIQEAVAKYGLHLREVDATSARDVEMFHGMERNKVRIFGKEVSITDIPFFGEFMLKSERHYITYLNAVSAELYSSIVNDRTRFPAGPTAWQKKMVADMINVWNGSAALSKERRQALQKAWVNDIFWAPQLAISRIQSAALYDVWHPLVANGVENAETGAFDAVSAEERKTMFKIGASEHFKSSLAMIALGALLKWLFADEDDWYDFWQADWFEKLLMLASPKIGNTTIDLTGGEQSVNRAAHKIWKLATSGKVRTGSGRMAEMGSYGGPTVWGVIGRYVQGKTSPWLSELVSLMEGRDYVGNEYTWKDAAIGAAVPLTFEDVKEQLEQNGIGKSLITIPLSLLGAGGSTYDRKVYENMVNRFLEAEKQYHGYEVDDLLDENARQVILADLRSSNPLLADDVRETLIVHSRGGNTGLIPDAQRAERELKKLQSDQSASPSDLEEAERLYRGTHDAVMKYIRANR